MSSDESSGARPAAPIVLRIKLRYGDVDVMVQRFAANVGKSGLFLPTRSLQPLGAEIKFELRLADDTPALVGLGRVKSIRPPDPQQPRAVFGMGVELMRVTPQSRALILRMLEQRRVAGLPEVGLPTAEDIDAARRADGVESGRDVVSGPVSAPVIALHAPPPAGASAEPATGDGLLTSPRRTTGPIAVTKLVAITPLSPEPPRRRRAAVDELIARAAAPSTSARPLPELEASAEVDVAAAVVRARALAGGTLDAELTALSEAGSVPREISVEAASAELARQLGGSPVRRERSGGRSSSGVDGEPAAAGGGAAAAEVLAAAAEAPAMAAEAPAAPAASSAGGAGQPPLAVEAPAAAVAAPAAAVEAPAMAAEAPAMAAEAPAMAAEAPAAAVEAPAAPAAPSAGGAAQRPLAPVVFATDPPAEPASADRAATEVPVDDGGHENGGDDPDEDGDGDDDVAIALAELDADEHTDLGGTPAPGFELPAEIDEPGIPDTGAVPTGEGTGEGGEGGEDAGSIDPAGVEVSFQEFDDFEILAEADAEDPEVLAAVGALRELPELGDPDTAGEVSTPPPIQLDFAARLDLEEDHSLYDSGAPFEEVSDRHVIETLVEELTTRHSARRATGLRAAARLPSSGIRRGLHTDDDPFDDDADRGDERDAVQPIFEQEPSTSYTLAGLPLDSIDVDAPPPRRGPARLATVRPEPAILRHPPLTLGGQADDHELEHALEALDVDLDDLASPHADTHLARDGSRSLAPRQTHGGRSSASPSAVIRPASATRTPSQQLRPPAATPGATRTTVAAPAAARRTRAPRASSDDGIDIDFDDED